MCLDKSLDHSSLSSISRAGAAPLTFLRLDRAFLDLVRVFNKETISSGG
jgi:hypothetical protein